MSSAVAALAIAPTAVAQCTTFWQPSGGPPALVVGTEVRAAIQWGTKLVIGGDFSQVGGVPADNIAVWDPAASTWSALGAGASGPVHALAVWNGGLVAGGLFTSPGGCVASWNGTAWTPVGQGLGIAVPSILGLPPGVGGVDALTVWNGQLVAGGDFWSTLGNRYLAQISSPSVPSGWQAVQGPSGGYAAASPVLALGTYGALLVAATTFGAPQLDHLASFDGFLWAPMQSGVDGTVRSLLRLANGDLLAGGDFTTAGGSPANRIARYNGSWSALGMGANGTVHALAETGSGDVFAGGSFNGIGGVSASRVARWDGASWSALGSGTDGTVRALAFLTTDSSLAVGGSFDSAGGTPAARLAAWSGSEWRLVPFIAPQVFGMDDEVRTMVRMPDGDLVVGGYFTSSNGVVTNGVARWNGSAWVPLGSGMSGGPSPAVLALCLLPNGDLVAGGVFALAGGNLVNNIARWDGSTWSPLGSGMNSTVRSLTVRANGDLVAGGAFTSAGGIAASRIARWDGAAWSPLGTGTNGTVLTLANLADGDLVAAGSFINAGGGFANNIARWNGTAWSSLGGGVSSVVNQVVTLPDGSLVAGGVFTQAGGAPASRVARWNGVSWSALSTGANSAVYTVEALPNGDVVAGGSFTSAGSVGASRIARWNGVSWAPLGSGMSNSSIVHCIASLPGGHLVAGGTFSAAGGTAVQHIAHWDGVSWSPLGSPVGCGFTGGDALCFATMSDGALVAGGAFLAAGGRSASRIALWDGVLWSPLGSGMDGTVRCLAVRNDEIFAGGEFLSAGGTAAIRLAQWNGTAWAPLAGGGALDTVHAMLFSSGGTIPSGHLVVGGAFPAKVAVWSGTGFYPLQGVLPQPLPSVRSLAILPNTDLVVGTEILTPGGGPACYAWNGVGWYSILSLTMTLGFAVPAMAVRPTGELVALIWDLAQWRVLSWNGASWTSLGSVTGSVLPNPTAGALAVLPDGDVVAGGWFTGIGGVPANRIARWDGTSWSPIGAGTDGTVSALAFTSRELVVGGAFQAADGQPSLRFARVRSTCPALASAHGIGCPSAGGSNTLAVKTLPWVGNRFRAVGTGLPPVAIVLDVTSFSTPLPLQPPLPLGLVFPQAGPDCNLLVTPDYIDFTLTTNGTVESSTTIPNSPSLAGSVLHHQMVPIQLDALGNWVAITATNALRVTVGAF